MEVSIAIILETLGLIAAGLFWLTAPFAIGGAILYYANPEGDWHQAVDIFFQDLLPNTLLFKRKLDDGSVSILDLTKNTVVQGGGGGAGGLSTYVNDNNGDVSITLGGSKLTGASKDPLAAYWQNGDTIYKLNGTTLTVKKGTETLTITNFTNGDLGIHLKINKPKELPTMTTAEINDKWYNTMDFWLGSNWAGKSSDTFAYFDTLPWNVALRNLEPKKGGPGK